MGSDTLEDLTRKMNVQSCMFWISEAIQKLLAEGADERDIDEAIFTISLYGYDYKVAAEKVGALDFQEMSDAGRELLEMLVETGNGG